jgi:hypothetical protein
MPATKGHPFKLGWVHHFFLPRWHVGGSHVASASRGHSHHSCAVDDDLTHSWFVRPISPFPYPNIFKHPELSVLADFDLLLCDPSPYITFHMSLFVDIFSTV